MTNVIYNIYESSDSVTSGSSANSVTKLLGNRKSSVRKAKRMRRVHASKHIRKRSHTRKHKGRKFTSRKRIHYTKKGQPYVIIKGGKARFIKKKSARISRKRKGGRY
jgi:hypothetical protein